MLINEIANKVRIPPELGLKNSGSIFDKIYRVVEYIYHRYFIFYPIPSINLLNHLA